MSQRSCVPISKRYSDYWVGKDIILRTCRQFPISFSFRTSFRLPPSYAYETYPQVMDCLKKKLSKKDPYHKIEAENVYITILAPSTSKFWKCSLERKKSKQTLCTLCHRVVVCLLRLLEMEPKACTLFIFFKLLGV